MEVITASRPVHKVDKAFNHHRGPEAEIKVALVVAIWKGIVHSKLPSCKIKAAVDKEEEGAEGEAEGDGRVIRLLRQLLRGVLNTNFGHVARGLLTAVVRPGQQQMVMRWCSKCSGYAT